MNLESVLPWCLTLSADAARDQARSRQYVCLSTRQCSISSCKDTIKLLQQETPDLNGSDLWPPEWPDMNPVDYQGLRCYAARVHECCNNSVDELKLRLVEVCSRRSLTRPSVSGESDWERACRWTTFWIFIVSTCNWQQLWTNKIQATLFILKKMLLYGWACDFQGLKVSQGKVRTINRWGVLVY